MERKPVYLDGKAVYEEGKLKTTNVETVRYKSTPTLYQKPPAAPGETLSSPRGRKGGDTGWLNPTSNNSAMAATNGAKPPEMWPTPSRSWERRG